MGRTSVFSGKTFSQSGFTLLETMIALALLSILALASTRSIQSSLRSKKQIQGKIDRQSLVRDGLSVMKRDIEKAFHYYDFHVELYNESYKERINRCEAEKTKKKTTTTTPAGGTDPATPGTTTPATTEADSCAKLKEGFKEKKQNVLTHFIGEEDSLHFTSKSHIRPSVDAQESNLAEVGYFVEGCKSRATRKSVSKCLWRRSSYYIDDDVTEEGSKTVLVENIDRFELKYLGPGREADEWVETWKTDDSGDAISKSVFPYAVEITLGVKDADKKGIKGKKFAMTVVAPIRFPNNIKKTREQKKAEEAQKQAEGGGEQPSTGTTTPVTPAPGGN